MNLKPIQIELFEKYIDGTAPKVVVVYEEKFLCNLTLAVKNGLNLKEREVYINTKVLKHIYDGRPNEEFVSILNNLYAIVRYPDNVIENKPNRTGQYCFVKTIRKQKYLCPIEIKPSGKIEVVTTLWCRKENYIKKCPLLWSWGDDSPPS